MKFIVEVNVNEKTIANNVIHRFADFIADEVSEQCGMANFGRVIDMTKLQLKVYEEIMKILLRGD